MKTKKMMTASLLVITVMLLSACSGINAVVSGLPAAAASAGQPAAQAAQAAQPTLVPTPAPVVVAQPGLLVAYQGTLETLYTRVNPSVVNIRVVQQQTTSGIQIPSLPFGAPRSQAPQTPQYSQGLGSGFVWSKDGYIVSNNHVVDGADKIEVTFSDGTTVSAKRVGNDASSDLAVIKVDVPAERLVPVQLGDSKQVKVGQIAIAIGNPLRVGRNHDAGYYQRGRPLAARWLREFHRAVIFDTGRDPDGCPHQPRQLGRRTAQCGWTGDWRHRRD